MTTPDNDWQSCPAEWQGMGCESGAGHSGPHEVTIVWDQDVTPKPPSNVEISPGYALYLASRFGAL